MGGNHGTVTLLLYSAAMCASHIFYVGQVRILPNSILVSLTHALPSHGTWAIGHLNMTRNMEMRFQLSGTFALLRIELKSHFNPLGISPCTVSPLLRHCSVFITMNVAAITLASMVSFGSVIAVSIFAKMRSSRTLHKRLVDSVLGTTLRRVSRFITPVGSITPLNRWLDTTPVSRIITRCTQDIASSAFPVSHFWAELS
jgi:hypothetical protein